MAFNEQLADRVRKQLAGQPGLVEKKMFGGVAFLINGNMSVGGHGKELLVRIPAESTESALKEPGVRHFDLTGRPMKGWILVGGPALEREDAFSAWVNRGVDYALSLPKKKK